MLSAHSGAFNLTDGYYLKTVPEDELTLGFDDDADGKSEIRIPLFIKSSTFPQPKASDTKPDANVAN